jgi:hypothetical protein
MQKIWKTKNGNPCATGHRGQAAANFKAATSGIHTRFDLHDYVLFGTALKRGALQGSWHALT